MKNLNTELLGCILSACIVFSTAGLSEENEADLTFSMQEGNGFKLGIAINSTDYPFPTRIGFEIGQRLYPGNEAQKKTIKADEYGPFIGLDLYRMKLTKITWKVAWNRLDLPTEASKNSVSRFNFVLGIQSLVEFSWKLGLGLSWRNDDSSDIEVGKQRINETIIFFPSFGFGLQF